MPATATTHRPLDAGGPLSVHRAFVVHLAAPGGTGRRRFRGRVEHLASGRTAEFSSLGALLGFFAAMLAAAEPAPRRGGSSDP